MKHLSVHLAALLLCMMPSIVQAAENRCGWIQNPTPGNWWLADKDKIWTLRTQGSDAEPEGMDLIPDISVREFEKVNGSYGYGCACMKVETDGKETITKIVSFKQLKLSQCKKDKSLKF